MPKSGFHFRLASVLKLRESARDQRRLALAETLVADADLERQLEQVRDELAALRLGQPASGSAATIDLARLVEADRYASVLHGRQQSLLDQRRLLAEEIDNRRAAVVEADADVRALEKLREAEWSRHRDAQQRSENKQLDEVASRQDRFDGRA